MLFLWFYFVFRVFLIVLFRIFISCRGGRVRSADMMILCKFIISYIKEFLRVVVKINYTGFRARTTSSFFQGKKGTKMPWERPCFANHLLIKIVSKGFMGLNSTQLLNSPALKTVCKLAQ